MMIKVNGRERRRRHPSRNRSGIRRETGVPAAKTSGTSCGQGAPSEGLSFAGKALWTQMAKQLESNGKIRQRAKVSPTTLNDAIGSACPDSCSRVL